MSFKFAQEEFLEFEDILKEALQVEKTPVERSTKDSEDSENFSSSEYSLENRIAKLFQAFNPIFPEHWQLFAVNLNGIFGLIIKYIKHERSSSTLEGKAKCYNNSLVVELVYNWLLWGKPFIFFVIPAQQEPKLVEKAYKAAATPYIEAIMQALENLKEKLEAIIILASQGFNLQEIISLIKEIKGIKKNITKEFIESPKDHIAEPLTQPLILDHVAAALVVRRALLASSYKEAPAEDPSPSKADPALDLNKEPCPVISPIINQNLPGPLIVAQAIEKPGTAKALSNKNVFYYWIASAIIETALVLSLLTAAGYAAFSKPSFKKRKPIIIYSCLGLAISLSIATIATLYYVANIRTEEEENLNQQNFPFLLLQRAEIILPKESQLC